MTKKKPKKVIVIGGKRGKKGEKNLSETKEVMLQHLKDLITDPGWLILVKALEENIKVTESKLFAELDWADGDTMEELQNQRSDRVHLKNLPKELIKEYKDKDVFPPALDPFD